MELEEFTKDMFFQKVGFVFTPRSGNRKHRLMLLNIFKQFLNLNEIQFESSRLSGNVSLHIMAWTRESGIKGIMDFVPRGYCSKYDTKVRISTDVLLKYLNGVQKYADFQWIKGKGFFYAAHPIDFG